MTELYLLLGFAGQIVLTALLLALVLPPLISGIWMIPGLKQTVYPFREQMEKAAKIFEREIDEEIANPDRISANPGALERQAAFARGFADITSRTRAAYIVLVAIGTGLMTWINVITKPDGWLEKLARLFS